MNTVAKFVACILVTLTIMFHHGRADACVPVFTAGNNVGNFLCQQNTRNDSGPVMWHPRVYLVFWGWQGCGPTTSDACPNDTADYRHVAESLVIDYGPSTFGGHSGIGGTQWSALVQQYGGDFWNSPGTYGGYDNMPGLLPSDGSRTWFDNTNPYFDPDCTDGGPLCGSQKAQNEVAAAATYFGISLSQNTESIIVLVRPPTADNCGRGNCGPPGYHSVLQSAFGAWLNGSISYIDLSYAGPPGAGAQYEFEHEFVETVTNPRHPVAESWISLVPNTDGEVADLCAFQGALPGIAVALQPSNKPQWTSVLVPNLSDIAGNNSQGACAYGSAWYTHQFAIGGNYHIYHQQITTGMPSFNPGDHVPHTGLPFVQAGWVDWGTLNSNSTLSGGPAVASWSWGRQDLFNLNAAGEMLHGFTDSSNALCPTSFGMPCTENWGTASLPNYFYAQPAVASWGPQRYDVFATEKSAGTNGSLFHRTYDAGVLGPWISRSHPPGVFVKSAPAVAVYSPISSLAGTNGRIDTFVVGENNSLYNGAWDGTNFVWTPWFTFPSGYTVASNPAVASWLPGRFDVMIVAIGPDSKANLWDCGGSNFIPWGSCSLWTPPTGITFDDGRGNVVASPGIVALGDQRLLISMRGSDGQAWMKLWHWGQNTGPWVASGGWLAGAGLGLEQMPP
jgi:hypothetical protein